MNLKDSVSVLEVKLVKWPSHWFGRSTPVKFQAFDRFSKLTQDTVVFIDLLNVGVLLTQFQLLSCLVVRFSDQRIIF